jgi:hypothetical protein
MTPMTHTQDLTPAIPIQRKASRAMTATLIALFAFLFVKGLPGQWHFHKRCPTAERLVSRLLPPPGLAQAQKAGLRVGHVPPEVAFFSGPRGVSPSPAASRLCRDLASGSGQRPWMSNTGSSTGDA